MVKLATLLLATAALAACSPEPADQPQANAPMSNAATPVDAAELTLTRLDCGTATIKNFDSFFSDKPGLYAAEPREITDSCYVIRRGDQAMIWDTGFSAELKGKSQDMGQLVASLKSTLVEQLQQLGMQPADIDIVGISHFHPDHTGQAAQFPNATLLVGRRDFAIAGEDKDPFGPWRGEGKKVTLVSADQDAFGDGSVTALHLPGHTPDHLALLVRLASGPVLLSGDLYHAAEARQKRGVPPFNNNRPNTLASMDRFEKLAKETGAKVVIQHEPADIAKLPAFPAAAK
jgi:N-acyl homoserine lactone hydrolase